jgi:hypothetical protein
MRACVVVLGVIAACEGEKNASAPEPKPPLTAEDIESPAERAPQTTPAKEKPQEWRRSRWDAPTDLPHLASTDHELRRKIDGLVATMLDVKAGRDALRARDELVTLSKPVFPRVLAAMAEIRDTITDNDSAEERRIELSLQRADECLREIDGWLTSKQKAPIRPGADRKYIAYIIRLHYRRWREKLQHMDEMPGPFDPTVWESEEITLSLTYWLEGKRGVVTVGGRRSGRTVNAVFALEALFGAHGSTIVDLPPRAWTLIGEVPARMKKERESRAELGPLLVRGLDHEDPRLQTLARDCLRVLYEKTVGYDPHAPLAHRQKKIRRWREVIEALNK